MTRKEKRAGDRSEPAKGDTAAVGKDNIDNNSAMADAAAPHPSK